MYIFCLIFGMDDSPLVRSVSGRARRLYPGTGYSSSSATSLPGYCFTALYSTVEARVPTQYFIILHTGSTKTPACSTYCREPSLPTVACTVQYCTVLPQPGASDSHRHVVVSLPAAERTPLHFVMVCGRIDTKHT